MADGSSSPVHSSYDPIPPGLSLPLCSGMILQVPSSSLPPACGYRQTTAPHSSAALGLGVLPSGLPSRPGLSLRSWDPGPQGLWFRVFHCLPATARPRLGIWSQTKRGEKMSQAGNLMMRDPTEKLAWSSSREGERAINSITSGHACLPSSLSSLYSLEVSVLSSRSRPVLWLPALCPHSLLVVLPREASASSRSQNPFPIMLCGTCSSGPPESKPRASETGSHLALSTLGVVSAQTTDHWLWTPAFSGGHVPGGSSPFRTFTSGPAPDTFTVLLSL